MTDEAYQLYVIAELQYQKAHPGVDARVLFPEEWVSITNYTLKSKILAEALRKGIFIADTDLYKQMAQGFERV